MFPSLYQEEENDCKPLETLINGESTGLNLHNNLTLFIVLSWSPPNAGLPPRPQPSALVGDDF